MYDELRERLLSGGTIVLDGGTGTELQRRGVPMSTEVWCALASRSHPEVLRGIHEDYIEAGAEVIIANTFPLSPLLLAYHDLLDELEPLIRDAHDAAHRARDAKAKRHSVVVAGSISTMVPVPVGTNRNPEPPRWSEAEERGFFERKAQALAASGAELIIMEMMRDRHRTLMATQAAVDTGLPVWVGVSVEPDSKTGELVGYSTGVPMDDMVEPLMKTGAEACLIMHSDVGITKQAMAQARRLWSGPMGAYPDSGYFANPDWQFVDIIPPTDFAEACMGWRADGAQILGGCCGLGPEHIAALTQRLGEEA